jgi:uncharacterized protein (DUF1800 family)
MASSQILTRVCELLTTNRVHNSMPKQASANPMPVFELNSLPNRRQWLTVAGRWGLLAGLGRSISGNASWAQIANADLPAQTAWRALSRVGYGPTPALSALDNPRQWALQQVDLASAASTQAPALSTDLQDFAEPLSGIFSGYAREQALKKQRNATAGGQPPKPVQAALQRMDFSQPADPALFTLRLVQQAATWRLSSCSMPELENPLLARMTEFWFNHLNVSVGKIRPYVGHYLVHVIRAHAMGKFEDLLLASARHPAMLLYLDQAQSVAARAPRVPGGPSRGLNENYARELMELHTLGVNGGYSQADVRELARLLTGWTIDRNTDSGFRFATAQHDNASVQVLGRTFLAPTGESDGVEAIRMLARQPATAQRICRRLAQFFVADNPPPALVNQLSQTFLASQGNISTVLKALFSSDNFWAPENRLFKTPMDYACSALAATHSATSTERHGLVLAGSFLAGAGQPLHGWPTPDGYAFDAATWLAQDALTRRADFALNLARQIPEMNFLKPYLTKATLDTIGQEPPHLHAGLMLASPDFMYK